MIIRTNECLEERPRFSGKPLKESDLLGSKLRGAGSKWLANPPDP